MKKDNEKVSVIIPVYNAEKYISRCLDSILNSTYDNLEILIMNDGSTDNSIKIINNYQKKYNDKVKVYTHSNQGVALTRNDGIKKATGKYVMFIDNDDFISSDYIMNYYNAIHNEELDAVFGGYERVDINNRILNRILLKDTEWSKYMIVAPWAKIFKLDFIKDNNILFLNSNIGEDIYFNVQVVNLTKKIKIIDDIGYKWFYNDLSISNTVHKKVDKNLKFNFLIDSVYKKMCEINIIDDDIIEYFFIKTICWFISYINKDNDLDVVLIEFNYYMNWLNTKFPNYNKNKYLSLFKPKGELLKNRIGVYLLIKGYKFKLHKLILKILK